VAQGVEVVGVVGGQGHGQGEHRGGDRADPGPQVPPAHPEPGQHGHGQAGGGDEPGHRQVQVGDVVGQRGTEGLDLGLADVDLGGADAQLQEAVGEVADEEDAAVADEGDRGQGHQPRPGPQGRLGLVGPRDG
jgi:hypothetical protein